MTGATNAVGKKISSSQLRQKRENLGRFHHCYENMNKFSAFSAFYFFEKSDKLGYRNQTCTVSINKCVCLCVCGKPIKTWGFLFFLQKIRERIMYSSFSNVNIQLSFSFQ